MMNVNEIKATGIYKELVNKAQIVEDFIEKTLELCPQNEKAPFIYFKNRYLDFSKIE